MGRRKPKKGFQNLSDGTIGGVMDSADRYIEDMWRNAEETKLIMPKPSQPCNKLIKLMTNELTRLKLEG